MNKKLFVGRLPFAFSNDQLRALFIKSGTVVNAVMVPDAKSGKTRGFGFVDMSTDVEAQAAIQSLNGTPLEDKKIWVTLAREKGDAKPAAPAPFPKNNRRPFGDRPSFGDRPQRQSFTDRSPSRSANDRPSPRHFADGPSTPFGGRSPNRPANDRQPFGDRKPPFRGKRAFPDGNSRSAGAPSGERRPFRSADARPSGPPRVSGGPSSFPKKEFKPRDGFRGPPKRTGGRRPPPRG